MDNLLGGYPASGLRLPERTVPPIPTPKSCLSCQFFRLVLLLLNIISNCQGNKYFDFSVLEMCSLQPDRRQCVGWGLAGRGASWGVAGPAGEEAEGSCALMTLAEKLAGGVSPSEDLETDGI